MYAYVCVLTMTPNDIRLDMTTRLGKKRNTTMNAHREGKWNNISERKRKKQQRKTK